MGVRRVLSKKGKVISVISIIAGVLIVGGSGYLLWRVNREKSLSTDVTFADSCVVNGYVTSGCLRCKCDNGTWVVVRKTSTITSCWTACNDENVKETISSGSKECIQGSTCPACEWPDVAYCGCSDDTSPAHNKCGCRKYNSFTCGTACGTVNSCTPDACPTGWESCGISGESGAEASGCVAKTSCGGYCTGCKNKFTVKRYCKQTNVCDGGGWTKKAPDTVTFGQSVEVSGYGKDSDGVNPSSVVIKVDGTSVGNGSAKVDSTDTTKTNWSYKFTNLTVGSHKIEVTWKDNKGIGGNNCTLSSTFTVSKENVCDGGGWTKKAPDTVTLGQSVEVSGYGKDSDGVNPSSVVIKVDGTSVGNGSAKVDSTDTTKTNWSYKFTNLTVGSHKIEVTWKDNKGIGGNNCTLSSTFTVSKENVCDGGGWITEIPEIIEYGKSVKISGYGQDSDGVDPSSVTVTINSESVSGIETAVDSTDATKTNWSYTIAGLEAGSYTLAVAWKDNNGIGGSSCMLTDTFTVSKTTTSWQISKAGTPACEEGSTDDLDEVQISYVVTVTNKGTNEGILEKIVDTLDSKIQETFLVSGSITGGGIYSNGAIIWDLSDEQMTFASGESKTYQYTMLIPRNSFGSYSNIVTATTKENDTFTASATVQTSCSLVQTGILDDATKKIFLGFGFLALGMLYMKFDFIKLAWNGVQDGKMKRSRSKEISKVKKIFKSREKFEKGITRGR